MSQAATLERFTYGGVMAAQPPDVWPAAGQALLEELAAARGRLGLIAGTASEAEELVIRLRSDLGLETVRLGPVLADRARPPSPAEVERVCEGATVITDIDVVMWPDVHVAPLQLLTNLARRRPTIGVWPGTIAGGRAIYSTAGRPDHYDVALRDVVVLLPRATRFPDEVPFTIERIQP